MYYSFTCSLLMSLVLIFPYRLLITIFFQKNFITILSDERDAKKFHDTIYHRPFRRSLLYRLHAEWYIGDYEKLIHLTSAAYKNSGDIRSKCTYLTFLARAYFEVGDIEALTNVVAEFETLQKNNPNKTRIFLRYPVFQYYRAFLNKDYERCISITQERMSKINDKTPNGRMQWLTQSCNLAIAYYSYGDYEKAKTLFRYFIETTPKLINFKILSEKYLNSIEKGIAVEPCGIVVGKGISYYEQEILSLKRKNKVTRILLYIVILLACISAAITEYLDYIETKKNSQLQQEYEINLYNTLSRYYENADFIQYFNVEVETKNIDTLCVVDTGNQLDLVSVVTYDGGETLDIIVLEKNIAISKPYCIKSAVSDYYIGFQIHTSEAKGNDFYYIVDFTYNNTKYWFIIDYIEKTPKRN